MNHTGRASVFTRLISLLLCSLATVGLFFAFYLPFFMIWNKIADSIGMSASDSLDTLNTIIIGFLTFGSILPMYKLYFSDNQMSEVQRYYKNNTKDKIDYKELLCGYFKQFGKIEGIIALILLTVQFIACFIAPHYVGFICLTTGILYDIFSSFPIIAYILSIIWYSVCYIFCLWLKTRKWERERIDK